MSRSANSFIGRHAILGEDGSRYMTRFWIGRLRLHIFYRGDADPDPHDHPFDFWTFPLTSYVEEVTSRVWHEKPDGWPDDMKQPPDYCIVERNIVRAWRLSYRRATYTHRVLGRLADWLEQGVARKTNRPIPFTQGKIITIVWRGPKRREWGFLKNREGKWCWVGWKDYLLGTGKSSSCD